MDIIRNVSGMELKITLTEEEIRNVIAEHAVITVKPTITEPEPEPETKKEWHPVKTCRVGVLTDHVGEVIEMYKQGLSLRQIANHYGVCQATVNTCLKKNGVKLRTISEGHQIRYCKRVVA